MLKSGVPADLRPSIRKNQPPLKKGLLAGQTQLISSKHGEKATTVLKNCGAENWGQGTGGSKLGTGNFVCHLFSICFPLVSQKALDALSALAA